MPIDFTQIESGEEFELLCEDLLQAMGFTIEAKVARGPGLGKDIIAAQTVADRVGFAETHRYLVECKHYAASGKSVQDRDIGSVVARMGTHDCDRYILVTSTVPSEKVRAQLAGIPNVVPHYRATTWSKGDLGRLLDEHPDVRERYFPPEVAPAPTPAGALAERVEGLLTVMGFACQERQAAADRVRLVCTSKGAFARPVAVVCKEGTVERGDVEVLLAEVKAQDLGGGVLVTHARVSPAARERAAETEGAVRAFTLDEFYRELIDFEGYVRALVADYEEDELSTYYVDLGCRSADGSVYKPMDDYVDRWLDDPARNHISILGDYGTGKTSFCRQYAAKLGRRWLADPDHHRIPILISLRDYAKSMNLEQLVTDFLVNRYGIQIGYDAFRRFNASGKLVLLFDGFDEMAQKVDYQTTVDNFEELARVVEAHSKVVLTCRTPYFRTSREAEELLRGQLPESSQLSGSWIDLTDRPNFEIVHLLPFDQEDIRAMLQARFPDEWERYWQQIESTYNLAELVQRPVLLDMIARWLPELEPGQAINAARLYEVYTDLWLARDEEKGRKLITRADKRLFMQELALEMLHRREVSIHYSRLPERVREHFHLEKAQEIDYFEHDIRTCSFLNRDPEGNYCFVHKSFQEFFVAQWLAPRLLDGSAPEIATSEEIDSFVRGLLAEVAGVELLEQIVPEKPSLPLPPSELVEACVVGECVLYAGPGLSAQAGFPTWKPFVLDLLNWAIENEFVGRRSGESLHAVLVQGQPDLVADSIVSVLQTKAQREALYDYLREVFLDPFLQLPRSHRSLAEIKFSAVLTTNFDNLLERTYEHFDAQIYTPKDTELLLEALTRDEFFILKLYGALEQPETVLASPAQYEDTIADNRPFSQFMESLFFSKTILFVGTSLEGIEAFLEGFTFQRYISHQHYALVAVTGSAWQAKAELLSKRYGIQVLPYTLSDDHREVPEFLEKLAQKVRTEAERTRQERDRQSARLKRVRFENIGPFDHLELELDPRWNILLGDNGVGKSTILKAIAVAICGKDAQPYADRFIKTGKNSAKIILETTEREYMTELLRTDRVVEVKSTPPVRPLEAEGWLALGFPPLRTVSWEQPEGPQQEKGKRRPTRDDLLSLVRGDPDPRLDELKQWIINLDYLRSKDKSYEKLLQEFFRIVDSLTEDMTIQFKEVDPDTWQVKVITDDGEVPIEAVSQGTASLISWVGFLLERLYEIYDHKDNPREQYALVLVDEIDAHMHPEWQQSLVPNLAELFPNVQFIATTHSPLIVGSREPHEVFRLRRDEEEPQRVIVERIEEPFQGWRADQILTGPLFGLQSTRDPETLKFLMRYTELAACEELSLDEQRELEEAAKVLRIRLPSPAERKEAREASKMIQQALRKQWEAMPLEERRQVLQEVEVELQELITGSRRPK
jgi:predicted ATPase